MQPESEYRMIRVQKADGHYTFKHYIVSSGGDDPVEEESSELVRSVSDNLERQEHQNE